jgi:hypothetical protein
MLLEAGFLVGSHGARFAEIAAAIILFLAVDQRESIATLFAEFRTLAEVDVVVVLLRSKAVRGWPAGVAEEASVGGAVEAFSVGEKSTIHTTPDRVPIDDLVEAVKGVELFVGATVSG